MRYSKYRAKPTYVDNIRFASKREAERYSELKLLEKAGEITMLHTQEKFPITVKGMYICTYISDFTYWHDGEPVVEDVKGYRTPVYQLKKKLMLATYGYEITEVK